MGWVGSEIEHEGPMEEADAAALRVRSHPSKTTPAKGLPKAVVGWGTRAERCSGQRK